MKARFFNKYVFFQQIPIYPAAVSDRRPAVDGLARTMGCDDPLIPWAAAYCLACMRRGITIVAFSDVEYDDAAASAESTLTVRPSMIGDRLPCSDNDGPGQRDGKSKANKTSGPA